MRKHIDEAIYELRNRSAKYEKSERYYDGQHDLAFATEKFENTFGQLFREFALNLCPVICDAVRDKLKVTGFSVESVGSPNASIGSPQASSRRAALKDASADAAARNIWHRNRMATRSGELHKEALKCGDAYMIVWPDANGQAIMYPHRAATIFTAYDEDAPGRILWAAKSWQTRDKLIRLNLFFPDRIERYVTRKPAEAIPEAKEFVAVNAPMRNPYGVIPVFHFANNADLGAIGRSELESAIPVQDGLNKSVLDMLVAMEFSAFRQRWAAGIEYEIGADGNAVTPFKAGIDQIWMASNADAKFGDFNTAELDQFLKVKDSFRIDMASVTGTPLHYFLQNNAGLPSGEALKKSETRFIAKVRDRQENFGQVWADAMAFALKIEGRGNVSLITEWEDPSPTSEREFLENILLKRQIGLPVEQALLEAGYGAAEVKSMTANARARA